MHLVASNYEYATQSLPGAVVDRMFEQFIQKSTNPLGSWMSSERTEVEKFVMFVVILL